MTAAGGVVGTDSGVGAPQRDLLLLQQICARHQQCRQCCEHCGENGTNAKILVLAPRRGIECCYLML